MRRRPGSKPLGLGLGLGLAAVLAAALTLATGAAAPLFFGSLPYGDRALLTMVLVCWSAGGVATAAAYGRAFFAFVELDDLGGDASRRTIDMSASYSSRSKITRG